MKSKEYFTLKGMVHKQNSSIGSLGRDIFYTLLEEGDTTSPKDNVILDIKEQQRQLSLIYMQEPIETAME
ncbi:hypothetical protein ABE15_03095 [Bacillus cereus]|nr:hypothetical protein [Bacillus cereus]